MSLSRRVFVKQTALLSSMILLGCSKRKTAVKPLYDSSETIFTESFVTKLSLLTDDTLLFIGDSITDSGRDRNTSLPNTGLGSGFVQRTADYFSSKDEYKNLSIYNRGIGGNKTYNLVDRWSADCLALKPDVISILIGINDLQVGLSPADYYKNYRDILSRTRSGLPKAKLVICEPFLLPNIANYASLQTRFHEYRKIVRLLAKEFKATFIPYYQLFLDASKNDALANWMPDGIHPDTPSGLTLLSSKWIDCLQ